MSTTNNIPADLLATFRADYAEARYAFILARHICDEQMERAATAKYKAICDTLYSLGHSIAEIAG